MSCFNSIHCDNIRYYVHKSIYSEKLESKPPFQSWICKMCLILLCRPGLENQSMWLSNIVLLGRKGSNNLNFRSKTFRTFWTTLCRSNFLFSILLRFYFSKSYFELKTSFLIREVAKNFRIRRNEIGVVKVVITVQKFVG